LTPFPPRSRALIAQPPQQLGARFLPLWQGGPERGKLIERRRLSRALGRYGAHLRDWTAPARDNDLLARFDLSSSSLKWAFA
jgi:hypothetical protein